MPPRTATGDTVRRSPARTAGGPSAPPPVPASARATTSGSSTGSLPALVRRYIDDEPIRGAGVKGTLSIADRLLQTQGHGRSGSLQKGTAMSTSALDGAPPSVPPSAMAFRSEEFDDTGRSWDPTDPETLDTIVERVVERIEDRVVEELERRGRRRIPGVF